MTRRFNALRLALALLFALVLPIGTASAHPRLLRAVPAAESRLPVAPRAVSLTFDESVSVALGRLTLVDAMQHTVALDSVRAVPGDAKTLTAKILGTLRPGRYTVRWQVGGADGHPVRGAYGFVVEEGTAVRPTKGAILPAQGDAPVSVAEAGSSLASCTAWR